MFINDNITYKVEKPKGTMQNGQSRNSGHFGNLKQHEDKQNKGKTKKKP
jgi:hypothetical protein